MAGISSKALKGANYAENRLKYNGKELQSGEFADGSGLELYDYKNRFYDAQIGRFFITDPAADKFPYYSIYQFAGNEVPNATDLDGLEPWYNRDGNLATGVNGPYDPVTMNRIGYLTAEQAQQMRTALPPDPSSPTIRQANDCPKCKVVGEEKANQKEYLQMLYETQEGQSFTIVQSGVEAAAWEYAGAKVVEGVGYVASGLGRASVWALAQSPRGFRVGAILGENLPLNFPTIDRFANGVATSIKSMDVTAASYQKSGRIYSTLTKYIDKVAEFNGARVGEFNIRPTDINSRALKLAIQPGKSTAAQWSEINKAIRYALQQNVNMTIHFIK